MSAEEKNPVENNESKDRLDFQDAKEMTVGEAVRKDSEIKAGVTDEDGVLDRYIKQHRDEVAARKFDTKGDEFQNIDTSALDNFIKQQRQELIDTGLIDPIEEEESEVSSSSQQESLSSESESDDLAEVSSTDGETDETEWSEKATIVDQTDVAESTDGLSGTTADELASEKAASSDQEELAAEQGSELGDTLIAPAINSSQDVWKKLEFDDVPLSDTQEMSEASDTSSQESASFSRVNAQDKSQNSLDENDDFDEVEDAANQPFYKRKKVIVTSLIVLLLLAAGAAYGFYQFHNSQSSPKTSKTTSPSSSTSASKAKDFAASSKKFEKTYSAFFADAKRVKLKNDQFANLPKLEKSLKKLKASKYYDEAQKKYQSLKRQIAAINAVNGKFKTNAIVDGNKKEATVKDDANFDDISESKLNTGNATLDALLKSVIADGRKQLESKKKAGNSSSSSNTGASNAASASNANSGQKAQAPAASSGNANSSANSANNAQTPANGSSNNSSSGASGYGISSYDVSKLQRDRSRVPYDQSKIADSSNAAWTFNAGILEKIVAISQQRGYITGNNYILEKVNIINGNGYYNMFKPDGTYLFSINCKTGYFVGNASGHSDKLDF